MSEGVSADAVFERRVDAAVAILSARFPQAAPVSIDRGSWTLTFATGELVDLTRFHPAAARTPLGGAASMDRSSAAEAQAISPGPSGDDLGAHLCAARLAGVELGELSIGSWAACRPRLGMLLRARRPSAIGTPVGDSHQLAVVVASAYGLVPVVERHLGPWRRQAAEVLATARANTLATPVEIRPLAVDVCVATDPIADGSGGGICAGVGAVRALVGGRFTVGHLVATERFASHPEATVLALPLGDEAMLVASSSAPGTLSDAALGARLRQLATPVVRFLNLPARRPSPPVLVCRPGGRLAILRGVGHHDV